jgi:hypothetical protein
MAPSQAAMIACLLIFLGVALAAPGELLIKQLS